MIMASLIHALREKLGLESGKRREGAQKEDCVAVVQALSEQFLACEDETRKAQLWQQMCKTLPDTLFLAPMCYEGDDPVTAGRDRKLYSTVGSKRLYERNAQIITRGNPGYRLIEKPDGRRLHLRTLISQKTKEVWVPLFTDFGKLLPMFGSNSRITVISFAEACQMAKAYTGIIVNPGKNAVRFYNSELKKIS